MAAEDYVFQKTKDGSFVRKLFSLEAIMAITSEDMDGSVHLTLSASVSMPGGTPKEWVGRKAKEAWIALRYQVPTLACKCLRLPDEKGSYALSYNVPRSTDDLKAWISETAFFSDDAAPLDQTHYNLKDGQWSGLVDKYCASLHVSPLEKEDEWHFSLSTIHATGDARTLFMLLELFLNHIRTSLKTEEDGIQTFTWGNEVTRLTPPAPFIPSIVEFGHPPSIAQDAAPPSGDAAAPAPSIWTYPMPSTGNARDISRIVKFTPEVSSRIYKVGKKHGHTVTQVLSGLVALAYAQAAIHASLQEGDERFAEVSSSYEKADFHNVVLFPVDQRPKLPGGYDSVTSVSGAPLFAIDGGSLLIPLEGIKKLLIVDKAKKQVARADVTDAFWDLLVPGAAAAIEKLDTKLENYLPHSLAYYGFVESGLFVPSEFFRGPYTLVSSLGNLDRLNILTAYPTPSSSSEGEPMILNDVMFGFRNRGAGLSCHAYQFKGELTCTFASALDNTSAEMFDETLKALNGWVELLF